MSSSPQDQKPELSVVVCTYRREEEMRDLVGDLLRQEGVAPEIVLVDQTPEHEPTTKRFLEKHRSRIRHLRLTEPNLPNARNEGIAAARGDVLVFIDDDLRVEADFLRSIRDEFRNPVVDGLAPLVVYEHDGKVDSHASALERLPPGWEQEARIRVSRVAGACMAFRRKLVVEVGGFEALLGRLNPSASNEDFEFCGRWVRAGHSLWLVPGIRALHRMDAPGGCDVRTRPLEESERQHTRAGTFVILKEEQAFQRLTLRALLRLLRLTVVRRDILSRGPVESGRALRRMTTTLYDVRRFWELHRAAEQGLASTDAVESSVVVGSANSRPGADSGAPGERG